MPIKIFIKCWVVYWILILIAPFQAIVDSAWIGIAVQLLFFCSVLTGYFAFPAGKYQTSKIKFELPRESAFYLRLFWLSIFLSLFGSLSLTVDRVLFQGISFSEGLAVAREKWRLAGEARGGGISSIYSVLGYFTAPAFYYSIINLVIYKTVHRTLKWKWLLILLLIGWNTILTGGRSVAFVALIMFISAQAYRRQFYVSENSRSLLHFLKGNSLIVNKKSFLTLCVIVTLLAYSLYVFKARSAANGMDVTEYVDQALYGLGLEMYPIISENREYIPFSDIFYLAALFTGYLLHSYVVTARIFMYSGENDALVIFSGFGLILSKIGLISPPKIDWFLAGSFSSLPGALYMQGGFVLMFVFGFLTGLLTRLVTLFIYKHPYNSMLLFTYVILLSILVASPVLFIFDSLMFPFILIQFVLFSFLLKYRFRLGIKQQLISIRPHEE